MIKRTLMAFGLCLALLGGASTAAHAAQPTATPTDLIAGATGPQTADAETGADAQTQDGDNVQAGDQSGPDTPDQSGPDTPDQSGPDTPDQSGQ